VEAAPSQLASAKRRAKQGVSFAALIISVGNMHFYTPKKTRLSNPEIQPGTFVLQNGGKTGRKTVCQP
jgi:hypothetical protein